MPELKKLIAEFGKIGSNLSQIARHFSQGGIHSQEMRLGNSSAHLLRRAYTRHAALQHVCIQMY